MTTGEKGKGLMLLVDAHVHIYPCFNLGSFFGAAYQNFCSAGAALSQGAGFKALIVLTDWSKQSWFRQFKDSADKPGGLGPPSASGWSFHPTEENNSVFVRGPSGQNLILVSGRKIITAENLEVLALGTTGEFEDGLLLNATLEKIRRHADAPVPVVPWAVGKWWGYRGQVLSDVIRQADEPFFYLCDNGNRPVFWPRPRHFGMAEDRGIRILAGSDPLHFPSESSRVGRFGFCLSVEFSSSLNYPLRSMKTALAASMPQTIPLYGYLESPGRFLRNQAAMQVFKKKWKKELLK